MVYYVIFLKAKVYGIQWFSTVIRAVELPLLVTSIYLSYHKKVALSKILRSNGPIYISKERSFKYIPIQNYEVYV